MIQDIFVEHYEWTHGGRDTWKENWASSVELSRKGINTKKLRKKCDRDLYHHAICFNISGTLKYWFSRRALGELLVETGQGNKIFDVDHH